MFSGGSERMHWNEWVKWRWKLIEFPITLTLSWRRSLSCRNRSICRANQWTGCYMVRTSVVKELKLCVLLGRLLVRMFLSYCYIFTAWLQWLVPRTDTPVVLAHQNIGFDHFKVDTITSVAHTFRMAEKTF